MLKGNSFKIKIAYIISRIFDPPVGFLVLGLLIIMSDHLDGYNRWWWAIGSILFMAILPALNLWVLMRRGKISDIDITKKEERTPYFLSIIFYWGLALILSWSIAGPKFINVLLFNAVVLMMIMMVINFYWKISGHAFFITSSVVLINILYGYNYAWLAVLIPLVCWSRYVQEKHTVWQLVGGVGIGIMFFGLMKWVSGLC